MDKKRQPNVVDMKPHLRRVLAQAGGPNNLPRDEDGRFLLQGQYWDGGLPSQQKKMQKVDGVPLCKKYFVGDEHDASKCAYKHVDFQDRPPCDIGSLVKIPRAIAVQSCGLCHRYDECYYPHVKGEPFKGDVAVVCMLHVVERVCNRLEEILGKGAVVGAARGSENKCSTMVLFLDAPQGEHQTHRAFRVLRVFRVYSFMGFIYALLTAEP
eukprot:2030192-Pyramimonas_sp.AAC.1